MADQVLDLVRRFEPLLYFHPDEQFFPSDAKRYIEHCALWRAQAPFDQKDSFGGKGSTFPRAPEILRSKIAASNAKGEIRDGDKYLGEQIGGNFVHLVNTNLEERFLDLGGWSFQGDGAIVANNEGGVHQNSRNVYSDRRELLYMYSTQYTNVYPDDTLRESRFWYHAELFDTERLRKLMKSDPGNALPDLGKVFVKLAAHHPALLCYYFFFPAHEELLASPCHTDLAGQEFASFAGEWACLSLLLLRSTPTNTYQPKWIGYTGRRTSSPQQALDPERLFGMTVDRWKEWQNAQGEFMPATEGDHPKLFVALGTHSLYLEAGTYKVLYEERMSPQACGRFDGPDAATVFSNSQQKPSKSPTPYLAKILGGLVLGMTGPGVGLALLEGFDPRSLLEEEVDTSPQPAAGRSDVTQMSGDSRKFTLVHPKGVTITHPEANPVEWVVGEDVKIGTRKYPFIVDRQAQIWWPSDDGQSGYRGRWGPRVVNDPFNRRAGRRFPEFWKMFFVGLAKMSPIEFQ